MYFKILSLFLSYNCQERCILILIIEKNPAHYSNIFSTACSEVRFNAQPMNSGEDEQYAPPNIHLFPDLNPNSIIPYAVTKTIIGR